MAIFRCGLCANDRTFPFRKRLEDHLKSHHGLKKQYEVNRQINAWFKDGTISDEVPMTKCQHCGQEYNPKYKGDHLKKCPNHVPPEIAEETTPAISNEDMTPPGDRERFQTFLAKRVGLKSINRHMTIFDEWVAHCEDPDGDPSGGLMEDKLGSFIDKQPCVSRKEEVYNTYTHVVAYFHELAGHSGPPKVSFHLVDGKLVSGEEKAIHHRRRVHSPEKREGSQTRGRGQRDRKQTVLYSAPQPAKAVKNSKAQPPVQQAPTPAAQHQATIAMEEPIASTSRGPEQQGLVSDDGSRLNFIASDEQIAQSIARREQRECEQNERELAGAYSLSRARVEREALNMNEEGDFSEEEDEDEYVPPSKRGEKGTSSEDSD